ncbi:MAG: hypothetical protein EU550_02315 [Promethearchaeota archaeon]|nr:MAG: hypothetical protein EU550_02315 [Candidatus Lokiarchaeota archaeon]
MIIQKKGIFISILLFLALFISSSITLVQAHSPTITNLSYNSSTNTLSVSISHVVGGDPNHYIESAQINVNNSEVISESYASQPGDTFTYNFNLTAKIGASIEVTIFCSISGSDTESILVGESNGGTVGGKIPGYYGIIIVLLCSILVATLYLVIQKRQLK